MILVKPSIEHVDVTSNPLKAIELAGRTCYKSEGLITDDSAEKFVKMLLERRHHAMIEHSNYILSLDSGIYEKILGVEDRQYIRMSCDVQGNGCLVSGNPRALRDFCLRPDISSEIQRALALELSLHTPILFENTIRYTSHLSSQDTKAIETVELFPNIDSLSQSERLKHQVLSYRIVCNRGFTHENVRHRPFSYAQESTRFCNYKGGVSFIIPPWIDLPVGEYETSWGDNGIKCSLPVMDVSNDSNTCSIWAASMGSAELRYIDLIKRHWKPQQARGVLPIDLKTEIVVTGNLQQWRIFFGLRCTPLNIPEADKINGIYYGASAPHPQMQEVANMIHADAVKRVPVIFGVKD